MRLRGFRTKEEQPPREMNEMIGPFRDINEFKATLMSENWNNPTNMQRIYATFPSLRREIDRIYADGTLRNVVSYVNKAAHLTDKSFEMKLVALYSAIKPTAFGQEFQRNLLDLGMPYNEMAAAWQRSEAVSKCTINTKDTLPYMKSKEYMNDVFTLKYLQSYELKRTIDVSDVDEKLDQTAFYMQLRDMGIDINDPDIVMNKTFIQYGDVSEVPKQGVKLHISAMDECDYMDLLQNVVPDLIAAGACFKVLRTEAFDSLYESETQAGKTITIYPTPSFDAREFFYKHPELFKEEGHNISGDANFGGRVYGRYGAFRGQTVTDPATGWRYQDDRHRPYPEFMNSVSINDFFRGCEIGQTQQLSGYMDGSDTLHTEQMEYEYENMEL